MGLWIDRKYLLLISNRLRNFKEKRTNLFNFSCPICGDSQINNLKARGYVYEADNNLRYHCHNCGTSATFSFLLKNIDPVYHREYVLEKFVNRKKRNDWNPKKTENTIIKKDITPDKLRQRLIELDDNSIQPIDKLPEEHYARWYVVNRKIPKEHWPDLYYTNDFKKYMDNFYPQHKKELVEKDPRLVWFLTDLNGNITHVCGRGLAAGNKLRYIKTRIAGEENSRKLFGLKDIHPGPIYITEGEIDSMFLDNAIASGDASLDLLARDFKQAYPDCGDLILVYDNEPRNKEIVRHIQDSIAAGHFVVIWPDDINGKDINEMVINGISIPEIHSIMKTHTYQGTMAQIYFDCWKRW